MDIGCWRERIKPLSISTSVHVPSIVEPPKLELKPLPKSLKYAFLGNGETLPVIIASDLKKDSQESLLDFDSFTTMESCIVDFQEFGVPILKETTNTHCGPPKREGFDNFLSQFCNFSNLTI